MKRLPSSPRGAAAAADDLNASSEATPVDERNTDAGDVAWSAEGRFADPALVGADVAEDLEGFHVHSTLPQAYDLSDDTDAMVAPAVGGTEEVGAQRGCGSGGGWGDIGECRGGWVGGWLGGRVGRWVTMFL